jgi:hypothetical protein
MTRIGSQRHIKKLYNHGTESTAISADQVNVAIALQNCISAWSNT